MARDLATAVGWTVFIGAGMAIGLWLGSLTADVPADSGMLVLTGLVAGSATMLVRVSMALWKHRPGQAVAQAHTRPAPPRPAGPRPQGARPRGTRRPGGPPPPRGGERPRRGGGRPRP